MTGLTHEPEDANGAPWPVPMRQCPGMPKYHVAPHLTELSAFGKATRRPDGVARTCRDCARIWRQAKREGRTGKGHDRRNRRKSRTVSAEPATIAPVNGAPLNGAALTLAQVREQRREADRRVEPLLIVAHAWEALESAMAAAESEAEA